MNDRGNSEAGPSFSNGPDGNGLTATENELWTGASDPHALATFGLS
jgi:hypothetical protein